MSRLQALRDGSPFAALLAAHPSVDGRRDGAAGPGEKAANELLVGAAAGRRAVGRALLLLAPRPALFLPFSCPQVLSSSCCSLCSSPARAVHPREGCIHSDLIENELFALISFVLGATLAAAAGRTQPLLLPSPWRPVLPVLLPRASGDALPLLLE